MNIAAPELKEKGGEESKSWLEKLLLNNEVNIRINPELRVGKWGRLLGYVDFRGLDVGEESIIAGQSKAWDQRNDGIIPDFKKEMEMMLQ